MIPFYRILLVEDDPGFAESVMRVFAAFNILLDSATDGRVALIWVRSRPYDAVITDLRMPIVGGLAFIESATAFLTGKPVLVMTASNQREDVLSACELKVDDYITKPVKPSELVLRLARKLPATPGLVPLQRFPLQIHYKSLGSAGVSISLEGVPGPDFEKAFGDMLADLRNHLGTDLASVEFQVASEFGYDPRSIYALEKALDLLSRRLRVPGPRIHLSGGYWDDARETHGDEARRGILGSVRWP